MTEKHKEDMIARQEQTFDLLRGVEGYNSDYKRCFSNITEASVTTGSSLSGLVSMTNHIEKVFSKFLRAEVCICIKIIMAESYMDEHYDKWQIKTIARSTSTKPIRKDKDNTSVLVSKNSDFQTIIKSSQPERLTGFDRSNFLAPNLPNLKETWAKEGVSYNNSTEQWKKDYRSTIVAPIRINIEQAAQVIKEQKFYTCTDAENGPEDYAKVTEHHIVGFLCLDSMRVFDKDEDTENNFGLAAELLKSYADCLYPLLGKHIEIQLRLGDSSD